MTKMGAKENAPIFVLKQVTTRIERNIVKKYEEKTGSNITVERGRRRLAALRRS